MRRARVLLARSLSTASAPGLYGVPGLTEPRAFQRLADEAVQRCVVLSSCRAWLTLRSSIQAAVAALALAAPSEATVRALDAISDAVCGVVDPAELCRHTHPDAEWAAAAQAAYTHLSAFVGSLNADEGLYSALVAAQAACADGRAPRLSSEGELVAASLRAEFERGGIHLPERQRAALAAAQAAALHAGSAVGTALRDDKLLGSLAVPRGAALPAGAASALRGGRLTLTQHAVATVLASSDDALLRQRVHAAALASPASNSAALADMLTARREIALLLGFPSAAALATAPLLAGTPAAPLAFLQQVCSRLEAPAAAEDAALGKLRDVPSAAPVAAWERPLLTARLRERAAGDGALHAAAAFFTLRNAIAGFKLVTQRLFGVELQDAPLAAGEGWAPDVAKLRAVHAEEGELGFVYLDLRPRRAKFTGAAHFVITAGRQGVPARVALVASLGGGPGSRLSHAEVEQLLHEGGHALHSLLSRTAYQHLAGTRGAQDTVEVPSTLLERLAWHPQALAAWARDAAGTPIPAALVRRLRAARAAGAAGDALQQARLASMDLALHGAGGAAPSTPAQVAQVAMDAMGASEPGAHLRFFHLVGYGSTYYSYLYGSSLSGAAWDELGMEAAPLSRQAGARLWAKWLREGGAADPPSAVKSLLGEGALLPHGGGWMPDPEATLRDVQRWGSDGG